MYRTPQTPGLQQDEHGDASDTQAPAPQMLEEADDKHCDEANLSRPVLVVTPKADSGSVVIAGHRLKKCEQELWPSGQRQAAAIHEVPYRGCFKPQLPAYFIERYAGSDVLVYDPFAGRGTTLVEAALHGKRVAGNDGNPLFPNFTAPRLAIPELIALEDRLRAIPYDMGLQPNIDLSMFYDVRTSAEIASLKR